MNRIKTGKTLQIPFSKEGIPLEKETYERVYDEGSLHYQYVISSIMKDNYIFEATMQYKGKDKEDKYGTGYKHGPNHYYFIDQNNITYRMFPIDIIDNLSHIDHGKLDGKFTFVKRGYNDYGVKYLGTRDNN